MSQPAFWLKITPTYVIENFEELLRYVSAYDYSSKETAHNDFDNTVSFLSQVARSFVSTAMECGSESVPDWGVPPVKALRMVAAAILGEHKRGEVAYDLITGLIKMLLHVCKVPTEHKNALISTICACARKAPLRNLRFYFNELDEASFSALNLTTRLAAIRWDTGHTPRAFHEGNGTVLFSDSGAELTPMNHDEVLKTEGRRRPLLTAGTQVQVSDTNAKRRDMAEMPEACPAIIRSLLAAGPSRARERKAYRDGDILDVQVTEIVGVKIVCRTIDPGYEELGGKLLLDKFSFGIPREKLASDLKPGDILPAVYRPGNDNGLIFEIDQSGDEDMKRDYLETEGNVVRAIYRRDYQFGTRWLTELGMQVNILDKYADTIDFAVHDHPGACLKVKITEVKKDNNDKVILNGCFLPESEQILEDVDTAAFEENAYCNITSFLLRYMRDTCRCLAAATTTPDIPAPPDAVKTLEALMLHAAEHCRDLHTEDRMAHLVAAAALAACAGDMAECAIARRETAYLKTLIDFASGASPMALEFVPEPSLADHPRSMAQLQIVNTLKTYKESVHSLPVADLLSGEQVRMVEQLVAASNTLIDKIDRAEISRIKKTIAARLGVADVYRDTSLDRTFHGYESDTLEFKVSCVRPPLNRQSGSAEEDMRIQAFTILKTVCAFLNSPAGGDLLIGVNDEGYAVGVRNDIDILADRHVIQERNIDRLRVYIKNIIDHAFISDDGNAKGNDITAGNVVVSIEQSDDGKAILRIKTKPYPYDVVRIAEACCLTDHKNVYYRSSATSMPLNSAGVRNIRIHKIKSLDPNERKTAVILEAIDEQKAVKVCDYRSEQGLSDLTLEPHRMAMDNTAFQAYDPATGQMRLVRLSRAGSITMLAQGWKHARKHRTMPVDIFGMMQSGDSPGKAMTVKLSDYALMLLGEEYPASKSREAAEVTENTGDDRHTYPWLLTTTLYHPAPLARFAAGLPHDVLVPAEGQE